MWKPFQQPLGINIREIDHTKHQKTINIQTHSQRASGLLHDWRPGVASKARIYRAELTVPGVNHGGSCVHPAHRAHPGDGCVISQLENVKFVVAVPGHVLFFMALLFL